jgi:NADH-quinone oxidoreductase subunit H
VIDLIQSQLTFTNLILLFIIAAVLLMTLLGFVSYAIYFERKFIGWIQLRIGPNRTGPLGLFQSFADILKLLIKEDVIPTKADKTLFIIAPVIAFAPAFIVLATIPYAENLPFADLNVGLLYYIAISGLTTLGMLMGGWASNNKYALLGGMRSAAQMISYEVPLVISVIGVILMTGSLKLSAIVEGQAGYIWNWNIFPQAVAFIIFLIAAVSELNRTPFDLPEAESELVAGYHVEYSGFRFAFFMLAEYTYVFAFSALTTILFLGGWHAPLPALEFVPGILWFLLKFSFMVFFLYWIRATLPRLRVDQLMGLGWKVLLPIALVNVFITAIVLEIIRN